MNTPIWHSLLASASFLLKLISIDRELAESCRNSKCPYCGGTLHAGFYRRKIRVDTELSDFNLCFSYCCKQKGCRRRTMPLSVRFCGRSPYPLTLIALAELFAKGASQKRLSAICELLAVTERTVRRWLRSWRGIGLTGWWRERLGRVLPEAQSCLMRLALFHTAKEQVVENSLCAFLHELSLLKFCFQRSLAIE